MTALSKYGLIGLLLVAILIAWNNSLLTTRLDNAKKANEKLVESVKDRDETITALQDSASADRRATEEQLRIEQEKRSKADAENRKLREALESSDCSNQRLPDSAIGILRREG
ncbi:DUF2570 family protein [Serratia fonticola]